MEHIELFFKSVFIDNMVFATFFFRALCDVTSFIVGPTQLLRGGPETPTGVLLFFPRVMNMNDWR